MTYTSLIYYYLNIGMDFKISIEFPDKFNIVIYDHDTYMIHICCLYDTYMIHLWYIHDTYMIHTWYIYDTYVIHIWYIHNTHMLPIWYTHDTYMIIIWYIYDTHMIHSYSYFLFIVSVSLFDYYTHDLWHNLWHYLIWHDKLPLYVSSGWESNL